LQVAPITSQAKLTMATFGLKPLKEGQRVRRSPPDEREILIAAFWTVRLSF
jgi:hypothetical protein